MHRVRQNEKNKNKEQEGVFFNILKSNEFTLLTKLLENPNNYLHVLEKMFPNFIFFPLIFTLNITINKK